MGIRRNIRKFVKRTNQFQSSSLSRAKAHAHMLPDFVIIGAQKAGTTSLYNYLVQHPQILEAAKKEIHYFDLKFHMGIDWYRCQFPLLTEKEEKQEGGLTPITGEASPCYLFHPLVPQRLAEVLPNVKLIVALRNPIDRAYSQYQYSIRKERENLSFEDALDKEDERLRIGLQRLSEDANYFGTTFRHLCYKSRGLYADQLERWFQFFPRENFLILQSDNMFRDPQATYDETLKFLGLPGHALEASEAHNSAEYSGMSLEAREQLAAYFEPHNKRLYDLVGRDLGWK